VSGAPYKSYFKEGCWGHHVISWNYYFLLNHCISQLMLSLWFLWWGVSNSTFVSYLQLVMILSRYHSCSYKTRLAYKARGPSWSWSYGSWISLPIPTNFVSVNPNHDEVYLMQHYVIKFVNDFWQVSVFLLVLWFPPPIKLIAKI
jgi:hypothetical protein